MDKNGDSGSDKSGGKSGAAHDPSLLDAASLFAYWNRDPAAAAAAAASNPLFSSQFGAAAAGLGLLPTPGAGNDRYSMAAAAAAAAAGHHHPNTMAVAASQAASLAGLHPAASWWSMAQLAAAQDYFSRLQASGLSQFAHPDLAAAFPGGLGALGGLGGTGSTSTGSGNNAGSGSSSSKNNSKQNRKEKRQPTPLSNSLNANNTSSLHNLGSNTTITPTSSSGSSNSYKSSSSYNKSSMQSNMSTPPVSISAYNPATLHKELLAMQAAAVSAAQQQQQQSSSSKKSHHSQQHSGMSGSSSSGGNNSSHKSSSSLSSSHHLSSSASSNSHHNSLFSNSSNIGGSGSGGSGNNTSRNNNNSNNNNNSSSSSKDRNIDKQSQAQASLNALNSLSQLGTLGLTSQQSVQAAMNALANSDKVKDYMPQGILSDPSSLLGVRLPPDTEIIKYTSSIVGPKIPGTTNRGRKKTISLDPNPLLAFPGLSPAKRSRLEMEYAAVMGQVVAAQQAAAQAASGSGVSSSGSGSTSQNSSQQQQHGNSNSSAAAAAAAASSAAVLAAAMMGTHNLGATVTPSTTSSSVTGSAVSGNNSNNLTNLSSSSSNTQLAHNRTVDRDHHRDISSTGNTNRIDRRGSDRSIDRERTYDNPNADRVEVIKLPPTITSNGAYNLSSKNNSQLNLSKDLDSESSGMNLSFKSNSSTTNYMDDSDAPLNLSMKPSDKASNINNDYSSSTNNDNVVCANSLQSLSSITAALGGSNSSPQPGSLGSSNNSNNGSNDRSGSSFKEGRPRNLGRGVSKPKKNTVASLLAQSRAVGIKPMLATQQLLQQGADLEKIRQVLEANSQIDLSTDSESVAAESGVSESESEDSNIINLAELKVPIDMGWKRETIIRGLTKLGQIRGDVYYYAPNSSLKLKNIGQVVAHLDKNPSKLTRDNFSFSSRAIIGSFLQPAPPPYANDGEYIRMSDIDVAKRLEDLKMFTRQNLNVEQRIEIAKQQQAIRDAKKLAKEEMARNKEKARQEKNEKLEQQRKERELKNLQAVEARKKRQEELEKIKQEEILKKQQELARQKELLYQAELQERERKRQHMSWIRQLDNRKKFEEREKKKHQLVLDRLIMREKRVAARKRDAEILIEIRKPIEDSEITDHTEMPELKRLKGCRLPGQAMADLLMVFEFLHNFGETLGFDMESLPTFQNLHDALVVDSNPEAEEELLSIMTHLLVCAIEDPGIPNPGRHTTLLGQSLKAADITTSNVSEVLRIYLYAVATGEVRQMTGVTLDRDKDRRVADHHQLNSDLIASATGKNQQFYELLHENETWKLSACLNDKPFVALNPTKKTQILAHLVNDLLMNKAVLRQIEGSLESCSQIKREKYTNDMKIRKYKSLHIRKLRMEAYEKAQHERELAIQHQLEQNRKEAAAAAARAAAEAEEKEKNNSNPDEEGNGNKENEKIEKQNDSTGLNEESTTNLLTIPPTVNDVGEQEKMDIDENNILTSTPDASILVNHKDEILNSEVNDICKGQNQLPLTPCPTDKNSLIDDSPSKSSLDTTPIKLLDSATLATFNGNVPAVTASDFNHLVLSNSKKLNSSRIPDDASTDVGMDDDLSDVESVITNLEEDEDMKMSSDEVYKKLEKMIKASEQMKDALETSSNQLRAQCFGQDRYWRRYWKLPKAGGIFVEAMESAQNEIFEYNSILEEEFKNQIVVKEDENADDELDVKQEEDNNSDVENQNNDAGNDADESNGEDNIEEKKIKKSRKTKKSNKRESHTSKESCDESNPSIEQESMQVDDDENRTKTLPTEDSILNQNHNSGDHNEIDNENKDNNGAADQSMEMETTNDKNDLTMNNNSNEQNQINFEDTQQVIEMKLNDKQICDNKLNPMPATNINNLHNNLNNLNQNINCTTTSTSDNLLPPPPPPAQQSTPLNPTITIATPSAINALSTIQCDLIKNEIKTDISDDIMISTTTNDINDMPKFVEPNLTMAAEKWFSIINREMPLTSNENQYIPEYQLAYSNITCDQNIQIQGHRWDIANNAQYFSVPIENGKVDLKFESESVLTLSGLKEEIIDSLIGAVQPKIEKEEISNNDEDEMDGITKVIPTVGPIIKEEIIDIKAGKIEIKLEDATSISLSNLANMTLNNISNYVTCDNMPPLSMTPEENKLLEYIKEYGFPKKKENSFVPENLRHGWWTIEDIETLKKLIQSLHQKGIRERELKQNFLKAINEPIELGIPYQLASNDDDDDKNFIEPDKPKNWSPKIAKRVELALLDQLEALEDKIANASMQVKHWQIPQRIENELTLDQDEDITEEDFVSLIPMLRERIASLEAAIERRYLKPPLGLQVGDAQLAAIAQQQQQQHQQQQQQINQSQDQTQNSGNPSQTFSQNSNDGYNQPNTTLSGTGASHTANSSGGESPSSVCSEEEQMENMPKGLVQWREAVARSHTTSQLAMALYVLESCVAWDKSIMKANCQFCSSGENEDKLLLCDGCDKGYHTYCFKPKMENIPEGDWYCYECLNKATNERKCIVCGGHRPLPVGKMVYCDLCPRAFHSDCYIPPLLKVPRGKWYCNGCVAKAPPPKKRTQKKNSTKDCKEKDNKEKEKDNITKDKEKPTKQQNEQHTQNHHNSSTSSFQHSVQLSHDDSALSPNHSIASTSYDEMQTTNSIDGSTSISSNNKYPSIVTLPPQALPSILSMVAAATNSGRPASPTSTAQHINNDTNNSLMDTSASDDTPNSSINQQQLQQPQLSPTTSIISNASQGSIASSTPSQSINQSQQSQQQQQSSVPSSPPSSSVPDSPQSQQVQQQNLQVLQEAKEKLKQEKKEKHATKKLMKELSVCKTLLADMEIHEDSWPFLLPVNTKQFPTYKKIIKNPMDLSTIKKRLQDLVYKSRDDFVTDVRQIFDNCEMFNEDDSPVGKAGHGMRKFFESRWAELTEKHS